MPGGGLGYKYIFATSLVFLITPHYLMNYFIEFL